jgi:mono/diheme cytochrome c family protein
MKSRWIAGSAAVVALAASSVAAWIYLASERHLRSFTRPPAFSHPVSNDPESIARGEHLVRTRGCRGCHGEDLAGQVMWGFAAAPNLPLLARSESAAVFEAALRHGIGRDGRALYSMPSYNFIRLRDSDVADIIAYTRSVPVVERKLAEPSLPWTIRLAIARGQDAAIPQYLDRVPPLRRQDDPDPRIARGEYLAMTTCNECHGFGLRGDDPWESAAPDLLVVMSYPEADFRHLLRTGTAIGGRELGLMSEVARTRFVHFTDEEVGDLHVFLRDMGARASRAAP